MTLIYNGPSPVIPQKRTLAEVNALISAYRDGGSGYHMKATAYPSGDVEILAIKLGAEDFLNNRKGKKGAKRKTTEKSLMDEATLRKSQYRSKKIVYQKILTLNADTLLTLTYRDNQEDLELAWKHFRAFSKLMKKRYPATWQYVCVPERQERGAIHFHLAIRGYYHWNTVRAFWRKAISSDGNVDFKKKRNGRGYVTDPKKIARYLAKYLTKQDMVQFNKRRYSSSRIELPQPINGWLALGVPVGQIMRKIINVMTRKPVRSYWEGSEYLPIFIMQT